MIIKKRNLSDIHPADYNPRIISQEELKKLTKSIQEFGYVEPIIINTRTNRIVGGHQRLKALMDLGYTEAEVVEIDLPEEKEKLLNIALNKISGDWDFVKLKDLFEEFTEYQDFDVDTIGFDQKEMDKIIRDFYTPDIIKEEKIPDIKNPKYKIERGDLWALGEHRLLCGDATEENDLRKLLNGKIANMVLTDPPYNVNYGWNTMEGNPSRFKNRQIKNDNLSDADWTKFVEKYMINILNNCNGAIYIFMSNKEMYSNQNIFKRLGGHWSSFIIWDKESFVLSRQDYHRQYEPILYGWKEGIKDKIWNGERNKADIWKVKRPIKNEEHPTMKPVELCAIAIANSSNLGSRVLDIFGGSGSTLIACEQLRRKCFMMELDPAYCSVIIERWENLTGKKAQKC